MKALARIVPAAFAAVAIAAFAAPAASAAVRPAAHHDFRDGDPVFALTDNIAGNAVIAYHQAADGTLT